MRHLTLFLFVILGFSLNSFAQSKSFANQNFSQQSGVWYKVGNDGKRYKVDTEIITIKFRTDDIQNFLRMNGLSVVRKSSAGYYDIRIPKNASVLEFSEALLTRSPIIESIDINTIGEYGFTPNDTHNSNQWYLTKIGMPAVWDKVRGNNCIQIAIIDSGLDIAHEDIGRGSDFYDNLWQNPGEDAWTTPNNPATGNGVDNDGNGLIDDWRGWDFANSNNDVRSPTNVHGTHVSGIVSAKLNNARGIAGLGGGNNTTGLQLMILGAGETAPNGAVLDDAILYAVQRGADVIQLSLSVGQTAAIDNAIQTAINNGIPVVCASGNNNGAVNYPANNANVIAVGATNQSDQRASFSNFGPQLFIAAPGEQIRSTRLGNTYGDDSGTSFAAPQVSAVVGLMRTINPALTVQQIRDVLRTTADKVGGVNYNWNVNNPGHSQELGFGRLNANAAINAVYPVISGPAHTCNTAQYTAQLTVAAPIVWSSSYSAGFSIDPSTGLATRVNNFNGTATITATTNGGCSAATKVVKVGNYTPNGISSYISNCSYGSFNILNTSLSAMCTANSSISFTYSISDPNYSNFVFTPVSVPSGASWSSSGGNLYVSVSAPPTQGSRTATIALTATGPCGPYTVNFTSTAVNVYWSGFSLSPNPSKDNVTISINNSGAENENSASDDSQNLIYAIKIDGSFGTPGESFEYKSGVKTVDISLQNFKTGLYIVSVFDGKTWSRERLMVQK
jgi:subtilisin family serine protease